MKVLALLVVIEYGMPILPPRFSRVAVVFTACYCSCNIDDDVYCGKLLYYKLFLPDTYILVAFHREVVGIPGLGVLC